MAPEVTRDAAWRCFVARIQNAGGPQPDETAWESLRNAFVEAYETGFRDGAAHLTESWAALAD